MTGYQIVLETLIQSKCVLLTGVSGAGKTTISHKLSEKLHLINTIELDEVMRQLVKKKHPQLKSFRKKDLVEYFGDMKKAKKIMWDHQLPAFEKTLTKYNNTYTLIEGMAIYQANAYPLIDLFNGSVYVIEPVSPNEFLLKRIRYAEMQNYNLSQEEKNSILNSYKLEVVGLKEFIKRYKNKIELISN